MGKRSFKKAFKVQDEWKTPVMLVDMLVPYLKKWEADFISKNGRKPIIWLPFDTAESNYFIILHKEGFNVFRTHLNDDRDFFIYRPEQFDIAVSNIPFSLKVDIFKRMIFEKYNLSFQIRKFLLMAIQVVSAADMSVMTS